jgi:hypothetical protein
VPDLHAHLPILDAGADRIVENVAKDARERIPVADDARRPLVGERDPGGRAPPGVVDQAVAHLDQVDGLGPQRLVGLQAREVQQVVPVGSPGVPAGNPGLSVTGPLPNCASMPSSTSEAANCLSSDPWSAPSRGGARGTPSAAARWR